MYGKPNRQLAHTKWVCKYHIVFYPKYRRKIICKGYRQGLKGIIQRLYGYKEVEIPEGHMMPDHGHLLLSIPPEMSVSSFMEHLKERLADVRQTRKFGNRHFWAEGYYVSTMGLNEATIRKYIEDQEKHDIALDKFSVREYDPFKGSSNMNVL